MTSRTARMHEFAWKDDVKRARPYAEPTSYDSSDEGADSEGVIPWLLGSVASLALVVGVTAIVTLSGRPSLGPDPELLPVDRNWEATMALSPAEAARAFNAPATDAPAVEKQAPLVPTPVVPMSDEATPNSLDQAVEPPGDIVAPETDVPTAPVAPPIDSPADPQSPSLESDNPY